MGTAIKHPVPDRVKPYLRAERQSARMSKITSDGLTRSGTGCFIAVPIWQQWASKGQIINSVLLVDQHSGSINAKIKGNKIIS